MDDFYQTMNEKEVLIEILKKLNEMNSYIYKLSESIYPKEFNIPKTPKLTRSRRDSKLPNLNTTYGIKKY